MNPVLLKGLIGVGVIGAVSAASVVGYVLLSKDNPKTIGEKIKDKTPIKPYVENSSGSEENALWDTKKTSYSSEASNEDEKILPKNDVTAKKISDKCKDILKTPLSDSNVEKKEIWAKKWCFKDDTTP